MTAPLLSPLEWSPIPAWHDEAACLGIDPDLFFPQRGHSTREATAVCESCPVRAECLAFAMTSGERFGIWGGLAERPRRALRRHGRVEVGHVLVVFDRASGVVTIEPLHAEPVAVAG